MTFKPLSQITGWPISFSRPTDKPSADKRDANQQEGRLNKQRLESILTTETSYSSSETLLLLTNCCFSSRSHAIFQLQFCNRSVGFANSYRIRM